MLNPTVKTALLKSRPFKYLDTSELDILLTYCKLISFAQDEAILKQGTQNDKMYILVEGKALVLAKMLGRGMIPIANLHNGDFVGEISLIDQELCTSSVIAEVDTNCLIITRDYFNTLSLIFPEIKYKMMHGIIETIYERLNDMFGQIKGQLDKNNISSWHSFNEFIRSFIKIKSAKYADFNLNNEQLHHLQAFISFNTTDLAELLNYATLVSAKTKQTLIHEGDQHGSIYIIVNGAVETIINKKNKHIKLSVLGPGQLFGGISYCTGLPAMINYGTRERTLLLEFTVAQLQTLQKNNIDIWYQFYNLICQSFVETERAANKLFIRLNSEIAVSE